MHLVWLLRLGGRLLLALYIHDGEWLGRPLYSMLAQAQCTVQPVPQHGQRSLKYILTTL